MDMFSYCKDRHVEDTTIQTFNFNLHTVIEFMFSTYKCTLAITELRLTSNLFNFYT